MVCMKRIILVLFITFSFACHYSANNQKIDNTITLNTGIYGYVVDEKGVPERDAFVYVYRNASTGLMGPADFMEKTDDKGFFYFDIPEGKYYIVVRKRLSGSDAGPIKQGDRVSIYHKNPVVIKPGEVVSLKITLPAKTQVFYKKNPYGDKEITIKLLNIPQQKKLYALIYSDDMKKKSPEYIKEVNESEFKISLPSGKSYIIIIRETLKEKIEQGEMFGTFGPFIPDKINDAIYINLEAQK